MKYVRIRNWDKYQSIRGRGARFIKLSTSSLTDPEFMDLPPQSRYVFHALLMLAGLRGNVFPAKAKALGRMVGIDGEVDLAALIESRLLEPMAEAEAEAELARLDEWDKALSEKKAVAGRKGGRVKSRTSEAKRKQVLSTCLAPAKQMLSKTEAGAKQNPSTEVRGQRSENNPSARSREGGLNEIEGRDHDAACDWVAKLASVMERKGSNALLTDPQWHSLIAAEVGRDLFQIAADAAPDAFVGGVKYHMEEGKWGKGVGRQAIGYLRTVVGNWTPPKPKRDEGPKSPESPYKTVIHPKLAHLYPNWKP